MFYIHIIQTVVHDDVHDNIHDLVNESSIDVFIGIFHWTFSLDFLIGFYKCVSEWVSDWQSCPNARDATASKKAIRGNDSLLTITFLCYCFLIPASSCNNHWTKIKKLKSNSFMEKNKHLPLKSCKAILLEKRLWCLNKPKMAYIRDLPKMVLWGIMDWHLSDT